MTVQDALLEYARINAQIAELNSRKAELSEVLVTTLHESGRKTVTVQGVKGTLVEPTRVIIDEERLRGELTAAQWKKITRLVLDQEKLEAHVVTGDIDPNVVASASEEVHNKPYVKVTGKLEIPSTPTATTAKKVRPRKGVAKQSG